MHIYELSFMYDGTHYVRQIASQYKIRSEEGAFDALALKYPSFNRAKEHKLIGQRILCYTELCSNPAWDSYDRGVASRHLKNYGVVFIDPKSDEPIDNALIESDLFTVVISAQKKGKENA